MVEVIGLGVITSTIEIDSNDEAFGRFVDLLGIFNKLEITTDAIVGSQENLDPGVSELSITADGSLYNDLTPGPVDLEIAVDAVVRIAAAPDDNPFPHIDRNTKGDLPTGRFKATGVESLEVWHPTILGLTTTEEGITAQIESASPTTVQDALTIIHDPGVGGPGFNPDVGGALVTDLAAYWKLDEATGNVTDEITGLVGANTGSVSAAGKVGNARDFNGSSQYITVPQTVRTNIKALWSLAVWVYPRSFGAIQTICTKGTSTTSTAHSWFLYHSTGAPGGDVLFQIAGSTGVWTAMNALTIDAWNLIVVTRTGSTTYKIYVNGVDATAGQNITSDPPVINDSMVIGRHSAGAGRYLNGLVDELGLWDRALSNQENTDLYNGGSGNTYYANVSVGSGIGAGHLFQAENTAAEIVDVARISAVLTDATGGSEDSVLIVELREAGGVLTEALRITPDGIAGGALTNPMTTVGDIIVGGSAGAPTRLAAGTDGHVLTLASGSPMWAAPTGGESPLTFTSPLDRSGDTISLLTVPVASGGTGATDAATARTNLGLGSGDSPTFAGLTVSGPLTVNTDTLVVDAVNNRVGINKASPTTALNLLGSFRIESTTTTSQFDVVNSLGHQGSFRVEGTNVVAIRNGSSGAAHFFIESTGLVRTANVLTVGTGLNVGSNLGAGVGEVRLSGVIQILGDSAFPGVNIAAIYRNATHGLNMIGHNGSSYSMNLANESGSSFLRNPVGTQIGELAGGLRALGTDGIGYGTGAGGAVTQATNKSTGVTLNKICGSITMHGAALAAGAIVSFTLTNSTIAVGDVILINHTATGTFGPYLVNARAQAGSAVITVRNTSAGSLSEAIVLSFAVIKSVTS